MSLERLRAFKAPRGDLEHLDNDQEPIFTTVEDMGRRMSARSKEFLHHITTNKDATPTFLDYDHPSSRLLAERGILFPNQEEDHYYLISPIDGSPKISAEYRNCQGLVVSGATHEGVRVSFMTHHNPHLIHSKAVTADFLGDLDGQLNAMKSLARLGSIDAVLFGGDAYAKKKSGHDPEYTHADEYRIAVEVVAQHIEKIVGFKPRIVEGPRYTLSEEGEQLGIFDTAHNHLHIFIRGAGSNSGKELTIGDIPDELDSLRELEIADHNAYIAKYKIRFPDESADPSK